MKILHTADIHLKEYGDLRWKTLERLIELGKKERISIFAISGDLFNKGTDAEKLRPKIRDLFSHNGFRIVIIPGNHDRDSFSPGLYFGEDTHILNDMLKPFETDEIRIVGLPFEPIEGRDILEKFNAIKKVNTEDKKNILLCHGELLDSFYSRRDFGKEGTDRYMPFWLSYFNELNVDYVLAGHFHTYFDIRALENGGFFIYPGSPVSITKKEVGRRKVNIFELGKKPEEYVLDSPHFEEIVITFDPYRKKNPVEIIKNALDDLHPEANALVTVRGFVDCKAFGISEVELHSTVVDMVGERGEILGFECSDIKEVGEDDLFNDFRKRLDESSIEQERRKGLIEIVVKAMIGIQQ